jgi:hypothetical protein
LLLRQGGFGEKHHCVGFRDPHLGIRHGIGFLGDTAQKIGVAFADIFSGL